MTRPVYEETIRDYFDAGVLRRKVDYTFGLQGEHDDQGRNIFMSDTLLEDWADRTPEERRAEAEARYDRWWEIVAAPPVPAPVTPEDHQANVDTLNEQIRGLLAQRLQAEDARDAALAARPTVTAVRTGIWDDPGVWDTGTVPTIEDHVIIPAGVTIGSEEPTPDEG